MRLTRKDKALIQAAASHERMDISTFVLSNVVREARAIVQDSGRVTLSERDSRRLVRLLENPPLLTSGLRKAIEAKYGGQ